MTKYNVKDVLPHAEPMILLDELITFDDDSGVCRHTISPESLLYSDKLNGVPSYVGIEYMAQSIAAYANANEIKEGRPVEIGFLVSSRKYKCDVPVFKTGAELIIKASKLYRDESGLSAFDCSISENDQQIASARVNVFQPDDPAKFLAEQL